MVYIKKALSLYFNEEANVKLKQIGIWEDESSIEKESSKSTEEGFSIEQRVGIFAYLYLYHLLSNDNKQFDEVLEYLELSRAVINNCAQFVTTSSVNRIKDIYQRQNRDFIEIFIEPDEEIVDIVDNIACLSVPKTKKVLKGLESRQYEHAADRAAIAKLSGNTMLEKVIKLYSKYNIEKILTVQYTGSNIKVNERNIPYLYNALKEACEILDIKDMPDLYLDQGFINAFTIGVDRPIIVLSTSCVSLLSYDELLFILGHELGHIKSQHTLYTEIAKNLPSIIKYIADFTPLGIGNLLAEGVEIILYDWYRKSEFSADRAGLLVCQNLDAAITTMTKLAGYPPQFYDSLNPQDFLCQAEEFQRMDREIFSKMTKVLSAVYAEHPWNVMRAYELNQWVKEKSYERIVNSRIVEKVTRLQNEKFCMHCGEKNNVDYKYCISCGREI